MCEETQIASAILCRGSSHPVTSPKPMIVELPLQLPLCDIDSEKSVLEEALLRYSAMNVMNSEKYIKEVALKLFAVINI